MVLEHFKAPASGLAGNGWIRAQAARPSIAEKTTGPSIGSLDSNDKGLGEKEKCGGPRVAVCCPESDVEVDSSRRGDEPWALP